MKRKILTSCALLLFSFGIANAQRTCGTMSHMAMQQAADPVGFAKRMQLIEQQVQKWKQKNAYSKTGKVVIMIPTVVHVVWNTSSQNISDAQVFSQIDVLNEDFRRLNADAANTPSWFLGVVADCEIEFCLAQRDPSGNPTNGITRTQTSVTSFTGNSVKSTSSGGKDPWPRDDYLNFWVCNLGGGLLGFAEFPGGSASTDGVVCTYTSIGRPPDNPFSSPFDLGRTGTHEIGHWIGLYHTFQNGCAGISSGTCGTAGDRVCDTPPTSSSNNGCPSLTQNTCTETPVDENDQHMNYMDYTDDACMNLFTQGQKTRMVSVLNGTRLSLQSSLGCIPPNLLNLDAGISAIISPDGSFCNQGTLDPVVTLKNFGSNTLISVTINYDIDGGPNNTYSWTGSLASFATEDITLPNIAVSAGIHTFNTSTSNPNGGSDQDITNDAISSSFTSITSTAPTVFSSSRCGTGTVILSASGTGTLNWYDDPLAGNLVNTGTTFTTPSLSTTTNYYVENATITPLQYVGPPDSSIGTGGDHTNTSYYLIFSCSSPFTLNSVKVYAYGTGFRTIEYRNAAGTVLQDTTVNLPDGESRVTLNFNITPGTNYQLATSVMSNMYRSNSGVSFPYTLPGVVSITGNNIPDPDFYYYYYDWEIQELGCNSARTQVTATITTLTLTLSSVDAICNMPDGQASVTASNGVAPYTYLWNDSAAQTTATATGLFADVYTVTITDSNGCSNIGTVIVNNIVPTVSISSSLDVICNGGSDGAATVAASGGTPPYSYQWDDPNLQTTITATGLMAGTYTVGVTDTSGCSSFAIVTINEPDSLSLIMSNVNASCGNNDGETSVSVSGGTGPYTYLWNDSLNQTTPTATGLSARNYMVTITDTNNCTANATVSVNNAGAPTLSITSTEVSCNGGSDGTATVTATGGAAPYTYKWTLPEEVQTTATATGLSEGSYIVMVTDANNCQNSNSVTISEPDALTIITFSNDATPGACDGEAIVSVNGGTGPYAYQWDTAAGSQTTVTASGLCAETYSVTITDANGCVDSANVTVSETTGIFEVKSNLIFNIYPNPTPGIINIEFSFDKPKDVSITVTNVIGEIVTIAELSVKGRSEIYTIDVSGKANGIYYIQILTDNEVVVQKVSIVR